MMRTSIHVLKRSGGPGLWSKSTQASQFKVEILGTTVHFDHQWSKMNAIFLYLSLNNKPKIQILNGI